MNQTQLTNMEGRWVHSTKDAFDTLVEIGYRSMCSFIEHIDANGRYLFIDEDFMIDSSSIEFYDLKQAYYHKGHFYDQPYEEFTITEEKVPFPELKDIRIDVTGCLEEKIDRRLHKNRPLALAIGRWLVYNRDIASEGGRLIAISQLGKSSLPFYVNDDWEHEYILSDNYIIPDQVIEWMHEYEKEEQCEPST